MDTIAIIGSTNGSTLYQTPSPSAPVALPNTYMREDNFGTAGNWVAPSQALSAFGNALIAKISPEVRIIPAAYPFSRLRPAGAGYAFNEYWLDPAPTGLPSRFVTMCTNTTVKLLWFVAGEQDAYYGSGQSSSTDQYYDALSQMHANLAAALGSTRDKLPLFVTPLGKSYETSPSFYLSGRAILEAQLQVGNLPGMFVGPGHYDLSLADGSHLDEAGRIAFGTRAGEMLGTMWNILKLSTEEASPEAFVEVKQINHNTNVSIGGDSSHRSIISGLSRGGTNVRVRFVAHQLLPLAIKSASIGVRTQELNSNTMTTPRALTFNGGNMSATLPAGTKLFSDIATLSFNDTDQLVVIVDMDDAANFRVRISQASMGGSWSWRGAQTAQLAVAPAGATYAQFSDACGFDLLEALP
jgi:hypothetical protein